MLTTYLTRVLVFAWLTTWLASGFPTIIWKVVLHCHETWLDIPLVNWLQVGGLILLLITCWLVRDVRPLAFFIALMLAHAVGWRILPYCPFANPEPVSQEAAEYGYFWGFLVRRVYYFGPPVLLMTVVALVARVRRRDCFLAWGHWWAPVRFSILFPIPVRNWALLMLFGIVLTIGLLGSLLLMHHELDVQKLERLPPHLPAILSAAAFNAAAEEYVTRMLPLAALIPVVGVRQAIAMTAVFFAMDHWYGEPRGALGVLLMLYAGWAFAKSMVETDGAGWAFSLHVFGDTLIFCLIMMAQLR
jgi:hypothetical protein